MLEIKKLHAGIDDKEILKGIRTKQSTPTGNRNLGLGKVLSVVWEHVPPE